jgi:hypothetical protein
MSPTLDSLPKIKVAVITVHGVADQQPEDTANTAANLLLHMNAARSPAPPSRYTGFRTHRLRIANRAIRVEDKAPTVPGDPSENCQHQFLRGQIKKYNEPDPNATYQTIRNEAVRHDPSTGEEREVHIYEMYWADLSRLGNSFLTFFVELYQLLFHLCTVGAKTARFAAARHDKAWTWQWFYRCIQCASHCIRLPIPIANLFVLAFVALAAAAQVPIDAPATRGIIVGILCLGIAVGFAFLLRKIVKGTMWPFTLLIVAAIGAVCLAIIQGKLITQHRLFDDDESLRRLLYFEAWLVLLFLLWQILQAYQKRHPGARLWGAIIGVVASTLLFIAFRSNTEVIPACQFAGGKLLRGLGLTWLLVIATALFGWILGAIAFFAQTSRPLKPAGRRAIFTANLVTSLTGFVMLVINIALWGFVAKGMEKIFGPTRFDELQEIAKSIQDHLSQVTIIPGMATLLIIMALGTLWAIWSLIPAVRSEVQTPAPEKKSSIWIGNSLTTAFRAMTLSGYLAIASFTVLFLVAIGLNLMKVNPISYLTTWDKPRADSAFRSFSWLILLFLIAPFFLKGLVVKLSAGFRQGLDIALDVINYLREHPYDRTIRAQIFTRYVSLLRYVCNWRSPIDGASYDRIVIFAHSQGTIITVDLLRFLQVERDPELQFLDTPGRIQLFTMGCPLRQLYGLRFPHIYDWARHPEGARTGTALPPDRLPDPTRLLSVSRWVNAYRSGDYVGRNLWRSEKDPDVYDPKVVVEDPAKTRREFCIGGGAHIHYWDKTAPRIAEELDSLIASA